jgi:malonyl-CoA O-methyltransferase
MTDRKQQVAASFSAAASTYDSQAEAQMRAADRLAELVQAELCHLPPATLVLEIGCGTGQLTRRLLARLGSDARMVATDISAAMTEAAAATITDPRVRFRVMDGEHPDCGEGGFHLVVSSLAAQWFLDLPTALERLSCCLAPGGRMMIATLGAGSFSEWRQAHEALGLVSGVPAYPDATALAAMLPTGGHGEARSEPFQQSYDDATGFLRALKAIGASTPRSGHRPLPAGSLRRIISSLGAPCSITYDIVHMTFAKDRRENSYACPSSPSGD